MCKNTCANRFTILPLAGMLVLILDSKTAFLGATEGLSICLWTVIPALFPFMVLSALLTGQVKVVKSGIFLRLGRFFGMPGGSEGFFIIGLLGGYPTGASCIAQAYRTNQLDRSQAERLLGFCSNAGPAFLFGIAGNMFSRPYITWSLWAIHILSAIIVARFLSGGKEENIHITSGCQVTLINAMEHAIRSVSAVCGWIILFRIILAFLNRWILWLLPSTLVCLFTGLLEISNGCFSLAGLPSEKIRFLLCSVFLAFGGICVAMQTRSVTIGLKLKYYYTGKLLQTAISFILSVLLLPILYHDSKIHPAPILAAFLLLIFCLLGDKIKVAFQRKLMYNIAK